MGWSFADETESHRAPNAFWSIHLFETGGTKQSGMDGKNCNRDAYKQIQIQIHKHTNTLSLAQTHTRHSPNAMSCPLKMKKSIFLRIICHFRTKCIRSVGRSGGWMVCALLSPYLLPPCTDTMTMFAHLFTKL